jgi:hypothetical protein
LVLKCSNGKLGLNYSSLESLFGVHEEVCINQLCCHRVLGSENSLFLRGSDPPKNAYIWSAFFIGEVKTVKKSPKTMENFQKTPKNSKKCKNSPKIMENFQKNQKNSQNLWKIVKK